MRKALLALPVAILAAGIAGVVFVRWPGDLGSDGAGVGVPLRVGSVVAVGSTRLRNDSGSTVIIDEVRLHHPDGMSLAGAVVSRKNSGIGAQYGWPPRSSAKFFPARGYRIPPHDAADLVIGARADRPGALGEQGVDVLYHRRIVGVPVKFSDHVGMWLGVCARPTPRRPRCTPPGFSR